MHMREAAREIVQTLQAAGHTAFWVGGCVRDQLLGREPLDYDIATDATPPQIERLFPRHIPVGRQFGVVIVLQHEHSFQIATFRTESGYVDGRHPGHVEFATAQADATRRDFTVNGLFFDPVSGQLHDWVNGRADLEQRLLRTIGKPEERFREDHLRLLRAVRFAAQLNFTIEPGTLAAVREHRHLIQSVSAERVRDELLKLFQPPHAARGWVLLQESRLLEEVLPELSPTVTCEQSPDFHPEGTVFEHIRRMLLALPDDASTALIWSVLLHDVAKPQTASRDPVTGSIHFYGHEKLGAEVAEKLLQRLRFPKRQTQEIATCVLHHMQFKDVPQMRKATLRRMILRPTFPTEIALHRLDCLGSHGRLDHYEMARLEAESLHNQPALLPPLVTGDDLLALGLPPGPEFSRWLAEIRDRQLQGELATRDDALQWLRKNRPV